MSKKKRGNKNQRAKKPYQSRGALKNQAVSASVAEAKPQPTTQPVLVSVPPQIPEPAAKPKPPKIDAPPKIKLPEPAPISYRAAAPKREFAPVTLPKLKAESFKQEALKLKSLKLPSLRMQVSDPTRANLFCSLAGVGIPVLSFLVMLAMPALGLACFFIAAAAYIIYTLACDEVRHNRMAILFFAAFAGGGACIAAVLTLLSHQLPFGLIFPLFPPSVLWIVFSGNDSAAAHAAMHAAAIASNAFLYLLYGCIIHYVRGFLAGRRAARRC